YVPTRRLESFALPWQAEEAYRVCAEALRDGPPPDAVVAGNDYFALGLVTALSERGLRVPEDVLVVGYGDQPYSAYVAPSWRRGRLCVGRALCGLGEPAGGGAGPARGRRVPLPQARARTSRELRAAHPHPHRAALVDPGADMTATPLWLGVDVGTQSLRVHVL